MSDEKQSVIQASEEALSVLAQNVRLGLMGLATIAMAREGRDAALACIDKVDSALAEIQLEARQHAGGFELVAWYASHGSRRRLVAVRLTDPPPAAAAH